MKKQAKRMKGRVISDCLDKTIIVLVESLKAHRIYFKRYKSSKKFKAHDEKNKYKVGDLVEIEEVRPISKDKKWKVV